jgi:uncharacterized phage infection (PIP) family protein YhgE
MSETFEELVTNHTRRELEEMAMKLGVETLGGTKSQLAESILDFSQKATPKIVVGPVSWEHPREATPTTEKPKAAAKAQFLGKTGVMGKISAANKTSRELEKAGKEIREEGIRKMTAGVAEFNKGVASQEKENKEAVAMINSGIRDIQSATDKMASKMRHEAREMVEDGSRRLTAGLSQFNSDLSSQIDENKEAATKLNAGAKEIHASMEKMSGEFQKAGREIREEGSRNLHKGLAEFERSVRSQIKENQKAASKIGSGAVELQGKISTFQGEIHRYQEQDLKNFVRDFYYG